MPKLPSFITSSGYPHSLNGRRLKNRLGVLPKDAQAFIWGKIKEFYIVLPPPKKGRFEGKIFFIVRILF